MSFKPFTSWDDDEAEKPETEDAEETSVAEAEEGFLAEMEADDEGMMEEIIPEDQIPLCPTDDTVFTDGEHNVCEFTSAVNHPSHYTCGDPKFEVIEVVSAYEMNFQVGNATKYILRAGKKDDEVQDLSKASWYLAYEIQKPTQIGGGIDLPTVEDLAEHYQLSYQKCKAIDFIFQYCNTGDVSKLKIANEAIAQECARIQKLK